MADMRLLHGDCLERMGEIDSGSVDMVLTDPPYGTTACKWDSIIPLEPMWEQLKRVIKPNGAIVMTASQPFTTTLIASNMGMFKYEMVWAKNMPTGAFNAKNRPMKSHENVVVFCDGSTTYNPQMVERTEKELKRFMKEPVITKIKDSVYGDFNRKVLGRDAKMKNPNSLMLFNVVNGRSGEKVKHPTQKPVALMEYLIKTYTDDGETVLDFTMGSGTTGVACVNLGRDFIGIERDDSYFAISEKRIAEAVTAKEGGLF